MPFFELVERHRLCARYKFKLELLLYKILLLLSLLQL